MGRGRNEIAEEILYGQTPGRGRRRSLSVSRGRPPLGSLPDALIPARLIKADQHHFKLADYQGRYWSGVTRSWMTACSQIPAAWLDTEHSGELAPRALGVQRDLNRLSNLYRLAPYVGQPCQLHASADDKILLISSDYTDDANQLSVDIQLLAAVEQATGPGKWYHQRFSTLKSDPRKNDHLDLLVNVGDDLVPQGFIYLTQPSDLRF